MRLGNLELGAAKDGSMTNLTLAGEPLQVEAFERF
jgi:hypothetical protein